MGFLDRLLGRPSPEAFAREFIAGLRKVGAQGKYVYDASQFRLLSEDPDGAQGVVNLGNMFAEYSQLPRNARAAFVRRNCLVIAAPKEFPEDFEDARHDLMPALRTPSFVDALRDSDSAPTDKPFGMPSISLSEYLSVFFVYDLPHSMQFIADDHFAPWDVSVYEAYEVAKENLDALEGVLMASVGDRLYVIEGGDGYVATRMIRAQKMRELKLQGAPVAMPVTRDCLIITGSDDAEMWELMAKLAESKRGEARPLCTVAHVLEGEEWKPWLPPEDHPMHGPFRTLAVQHIGSDYAEQKERLEKRHQREGTDVFVATYSGIEQDGKILSWASWAKGVATVLPKTDLIALIDIETEKKAFVPWDRLHAAVSHLMQPMDCQPPRWLVDDFPSDEELRAAGGELS